MPFYTKKPISIEARQITIENAEKLAAWSSSVVIKRPDGTISGMMVLTLEGTMTGVVGDYLIKGVRGEHYFCAKSIFEETHEEVRND
jgi:lipopolysaccharide export system protein LptA